MKSNGPTLEVEITLKPPARSPGRQKAASPSEPAPATIPRISRLMALAIKFQDMVDRGEVRDYADLARLGYVTRARLTQIMNLLLLAPDIQEQLLAASAGNGPTERDLRSVTRYVYWDDQRRILLEVQVGALPLRAGYMPVAAEAVVR